MHAVPCVLCGSPSFDVVYPATMDAGAPLKAEAFLCTAGDYGNHLPIVRCRVCGHFYTNPRWTAEEILSTYEDVEDESYVREEGGRILTFRRRLKEMERVTGPAAGRSLLDVGTYTGVFVQEAVQRGWNAVGVEPSRWCVDLAHSRGLTVFQGTLDSPELRGRQFDVITLWDVIEHMDDPSAEIEKATALLASHGYLVVHTMDIGSLMAKIMGSRWPWFLGMHLHFFSRRSLSDLFRRSGYDVLKAQASGRYLRLGYFTRNLATLFPFPGKLLSSIVRALRLGGIPLRLNFGDLMTVYGRKKV